MKQRGEGMDEVGFWFIVCGYWDFNSGLTKIFMERLRFFV
jgi:hypothetical protein